MSSSSPTKALCLLLVVIVATVGAASAGRNNNKIQNKIHKRRLPGSCLMAASTLCANTDTNAMRCLRKLAIKKDARVPTTCAEALMADVTVNPRRVKKQASRGSRLTRMLSEAGSICSGVNNCVDPFSVSHSRCNDPLSECRLVDLPCLPFSALPSLTRFCEPRVAAACACAVL